MCVKRETLELAGSKRVSEIKWESEANNHALINISRMWRLLFKCYLPIPEETQHLNVIFMIVYRDIIHTSSVCSTCVHYLQVLSVAHWWLHVVSHVISVDPLVISIFFCMTSLVHTHYHFYIPTGAYVFISVGPLVHILISYILH